MVNKQGFTILEVLLYSVFFTILVTININLFFKFTNTLENQDLKINTLIDANNIYNILVKELIKSDHIISPQLYENDSILSLSKTNTLENPTIFELEENNLFIKVGNEQIIKINSSSSKIENINFAYKQQQNIQILELKLIINQMKYEYTKIF